jgi:hypothetical protein
MSGEAAREGRWWLPGALALLPTGGYAWVEVEELKARPVLLVAVTLGWAGAAWGFGIVGALTERWRPGIVDWCDVRIRSRWHQSEHRYLEWVQYRNRDFDVKGLSTQGHFSLELAKVYVDLRLVPRPVHQAGANPVAPPSEPTSEAPAELTLSEAVAHHQLLAILGPPGSGKTTLLRHAALQLTGPKSTRQESGLPDAVPVLVFLREVAPLLSGATPPSLVDAVAASTRGHELDRGWLSRALAERRCLLMLDGLDEVADIAARVALVRWIEDQVAGHPGNRWIVTARPFGYQSNPLAGFTALSVQPLRRAQIESFLANWYLANEVMAAQKEDEGVVMKAVEGATDLLARIDRSPDLVRLAVNPLLLTLIANVHRWRSSLPGRRVELYAEICDVFLGKRHEARGLASALTPSQKKLVLQTLAWHLMATRRRELPEDEACGVVNAVLERVSPGTPPGDFFRTVQSGSGLLLEREAGVWGFAHKTFQEYLAALHAHEQRLDSILAGQVVDDWWHETIRLYSALADASNIIAACVNGNPPSLPALVLAVQCADEAREVAPAVRSDLLQLVDAQLDSGDAERRSLAAECRLEIRLRALDRIDDAVFADPELVTNAEYQLFVSAEAAAGHARQPDHWRGTSFPAGHARAPALGVRGVDAIAFCAWLTNRDGGDWRYRLPAGDEFLNLNDEHLPDGIGYWYVDGTRALSCWSRGTVDDMPALTERFERLVSSDLARLRELSASERAELGLEISDADLESLLRLQTWADAGGLRVGMRVLERAVEEWPRKWWWRSLRLPFKLASAAVKGLLRLVGLVARGWIWTVTIVRGTPRKEVSKKVASSLGAATESAVRGLVTALTWLMTPLRWMFGSIVGRWFAGELAAERARMAVRGGAPEPWSPLSLASLVEQPGADDEAKMKAASDLIVLVLTQFMGGLFLRASTELPARGTAILSIAKRADAPPPLARLAEALAMRSWQESDARGLAGPGDLSWATRVSLLLWWRQTFAEMLVEAARRKEKGNSAKANAPEFALFDAWFDAWAIGERSSGTTVPFEGIRVVKERRHAD